MDYDATFDYNMNLAQDLLTTQFEMDSYLASMGLNTSGMFGESDPFNPSIDDPVPGGGIWGDFDPFFDFFNFSSDGDSGEGGGGDEVVSEGTRDGGFWGAIGDFFDFDGDGDALESIGLGTGILGTAILALSGAIAALTAPIWGTIAVGIGVTLAVLGGLIAFYDSVIQPNLPPES